MTQIKQENAKSNVHNVDKQNFLTLPKKPPLSKALRKNFRENNQFSLSSITVAEEMFQFDAGLSTVRTKKEKGPGFRKYFF
jgi:hypothetical protein